MGIYSYWECTLVFSRTKIFRMRFANSPNFCIFTDFSVSLSKVRANNPAFWRAIALKTFLPWIFHTPCTKDWHGHCNVYLSFSYEKNSMKTHVTFIFVGLVYDIFKSLVTQAWLVHSGFWLYSLVVKGLICGFIPRLHLPKISALYHNPMES